MIPEAASQPLLSVLLCTCNRRDNVVPTIRSILACEYPRFELFILDQSRDDSTGQAVAPLCASDERLIYVRLPRPSKPAALNEGLARARGSILLLTDDDCEVHPQWLGAMAAPFADASVGGAFGDVAAADYDSREGYVPALRIHTERRISGLPEFLTMPDWGNFGMGANLALRRAAVAAVGGWDPCIGPGAYFRSGDDHDIVARLLAAGHALCFVPQGQVVHFGLRRWDVWGTDQSRYGFGMGASFAKHLRSGTWYPGPLRVFRHGALRCLRNLLTGKRPIGAAYPFGWLRGFLRGLRHPLDRPARMFVAQTGPGQDTSGERTAQVVLRADQAAPERTRQGGDDRR